MKKQIDILRRRFKVTVEFEAENDYIIGRDVPPTDAEIQKMVEKGLEGLTSLDGLLFLYTEVSCTHTDFERTEDIT